MATTVPLSRAGFLVEEEIFHELFDQHDSSAAKAVERIVERGAELGNLPDNAQDRVSSHAYYITCCILRFSISIPHDQQSKLVEFLLLLSKKTVPDARNGGALRCVGIDQELWTEIPYVLIVWRDYLHGYVPPIVAESVNPYSRQALEGFYAFFAQLSELGFCRLNETVGWCYDSVIGILDDQTENPGEDYIRLLCLWLIYAPNKLQQDALLSREDVGGTIKLECWKRWIVLLHNQQDRVESEDTQELINRAQAALECFEDSGDSQTALPGLSNK